MIFDPSKGQNLTPTHQEDLGEPSYALTTTVSFAAEPPLSKHARKRAAHLRGLAILESVDAGIRDRVRLLREAGIVTFYACEGGDQPEHHDPVATIHFKGGDFAGFRAVEILAAHGYRIATLERIHTFTERAAKGKHDASYWRVTFYPTKEEAHAGADHREVVELGVHSG
jgi:hypothetical protein